MLYITPIQDKTYHRTLAEKCGFSARDDALAFLAADADETTGEIRFEIGICEFTIHNDEGVITALRSVPGVNDGEALTIMARAVMSFIHRTTIRDLYYEDSTTDGSFVRSLGSRETDGRMHTNLDVFFASPCHYNEANANE